MAHIKKMLLSRSVKEAAVSTPAAPVAARDAAPGSSAAADSASGVCDTPSVVPMRRASSVPARGVRRTTSRRQVGSGPDKEPPPTSLVPNPNAFLLRHQNRALGVSLRSMQRKVKRLRREAKVARQAAKQYEQEAGIIGRAWQQLENDMQLAVRNFEPRLANDALAGMPQPDVNDASGTLLRSLVSAGRAHVLAPLQQQNHPGDDLPVVDADGDAVMTTQSLPTSLQQRVAWTTSVFSTLIKAAHEAAATTEGSSAEATKTIAELSAANRDAAAQLTATQQQLMLARQATQRLEAQLVETKEEARRTHRALDRVAVDYPEIHIHGILRHDKQTKKRKRARTTAGQAPEAPKHMPAVEAATAKPGGAESGATDKHAPANAAAIAKLREELVSARRLADSRLQELQAVLAAKSKVLADAKARVDSVKQVQNVTSPPSEALRKAQAEQTRLQTELTSLQEDHSDLLARHNDASKRFQAQLACIAQAGGDLPSPCGTCASLSADVAALSAQLAAAKTEASRCAALQKLCDEQASALDRMRKLAKDPSPGEGGAPSVSKRFQQFVAPLQARIDKLAGILADKDRVIEAMKAKEREATRDHLNAAVAGDSARISQLTEEIRALEQHVQETKALYLSQRADCERGRAEIKALKASLDASQAEAEDLIQEVEALSSDMQGTAGREAALLGQLRDKEQEVAKASTEYMRYSQIMTTSKQQLAAADKLQEASAAKLAALNQVLAARSSAIVALEQKVQDAAQVVRAATAETKQWQARADAVESSRSKLEAQLRQADTRATAAVAESLDAKRSAEEVQHDLRRAQEELKACQRRLSQALVTADDNSDKKLRKRGTPSDVLKLQVKELRNRITCSVCHDRWKDCVISKCFHTFCRPCIDERVRTRQRKCPGCGEKFGADDVHKIHLT